MEISLLTWKLKFYSPVQTLNLFGHLGIYHAVTCTTQAFDVKLIVSFGGIQENRWDLIIDGLL